MCLVFGALYALSKLFGVVRKRSKGGGEARQRDEGGYVDRVRECCLREGFGGSGDLAVEVLCARSAGYSLSVYGKS